MLAYLAKQQVTLTNSDNEGATYYAGDVLSDWELTDLIKNKVKDGVPWYTQRFEPLTEAEATLYRKKATAAEGKRTATDGQFVDPPWDDYIGLHPKDVIDRMKDLSFDDVNKVRQYESARGGLNRSSIIEYVAPSEREPWNDYDNWGVRDILDKMELLDPQTVQDVIVYEMNHKQRAAVITYEAEEDDPDPIVTSPKVSSVAGLGEDGDEEAKELAVIGAGSTDPGGQP